MKAKTPECPSQDVCAAIMQIACHIYCPRNNMIHMSVLSIIICVRLSIFQDSHVLVLVTGAIISSKPIRLRQDPLFHFHAGL